jgi:hypothetical protein
MTKEPGDLELVAYVCTIIVAVLANRRLVPQISPLA